MSAARLIIALPSKGELHERTLKFFDECGMRVQFTGQGREYAGVVRGVDGMAVVLLRADEIPQRVERGGAHLGVTGKDLTREAVEDSRAVHLLIPELGYGHARVVVAVPRVWVDVTSMADLEEVALLYRQKKGRGVRVATKFPRLVREFFAEHGISDYVIVQSLGATEGAPAQGSADIVVDITSTGTTLVQNHLKMLSDGTILSSQAAMIASTRARWSDEALAGLTQVIELIEARLKALATYVLRFAARPSALSKIESELKSRFQCTVRSSGGRASEGAALAAAEGEAPVEVVALVPSENLYRVTRHLRDQAGCTEVTAERTDFVFGGPAAAVEGFRHLLRRM